MARVTSQAQSAVAVRRLRLTDFRSYAAARLDVDARPVVLTGPNGAGKTNLLEAVSFLAPGRGLRHARLAEVQRRGAPEEAGWAVAATVETPTGPVEIGTGREAAARATAKGAADRRVVRIDGRPARGQTALAEHVAALWLTPQMDRLFLEGASQRRRFLDRLVYAFDAEHAGRLAAYEQAMRERLRLLKDGRMDDAWLAGLEDVMARNGVAVAAARLALADDLAAVCRARQAPFPAADLAVAGTVEAAVAAQPALAVEDDLRRRLAGERRLDAATGTTASGPHRSDLLVRHLPKDMAAEHCSTGEQKVLLIAIVLAAVELLGGLRRRMPLVLLDEVAAHLDATRRGALYDEIARLGVQAWLTGTDAALFAPLGDRAQFVRVDEAGLTPDDGTPCT